MTRRLRNAIEQQPTQFRVEFPGLIFRSIEKLEAPTFEAEAFEQRSAEFQITLVQKYAGVARVAVRLIVVGAQAEKTFGRWSDRGVRQIMKNGLINSANPLTPSTS